MAGGGYEWATAAWPSGPRGQLTNEEEIIKINCRVTQQHSFGRPPSLPLRFLPRSHIWPQGDARPVDAMDTNV